MQRKLKPRATDALNVTPATVSDRTCAVVLGLEPRAFRELLEREQIAHAQIGRRVVARLEVVLETIDRLAGAAVAAPPSARTNDDELESVDAVLARIGRRRSA